MEVSGQIKAPIALTSLPLFVICVHFKEEALWELEPVCILYEEINF
jgi:hypothetical protein